MAEKASRKSGAAEGAGTWVASPESKKKAGTFRLVAILAWVVAIAAEAAAVLLLVKQEIMPAFMVSGLMTWLIVFIVIDLAFVITGSLLWKKANRLDPASEKDAVRFFVQNQLGLIIAIIAFLPLVILIFTNKKLNGKQKGIVGAVAIVALLAAGYFGIDFNPASIEKYAAETKQVTDLTGANIVYWTAGGGSYHLFSDCFHIRGKEPGTGSPGTVADAKSNQNITDLCDDCVKRYKKENPAAAVVPAESVTTESVTAAE